MGTRKNPVHRPYVVVQPAMQTRDPTVPTEPRVAPIDGRPVIGIDRYEARVLHEATSFRLFVSGGGARPVEREPPQTREQALAWVGHKCLVYAITKEGRSCCVTERTVKVHDTIYGRRDT